jgi:glycine/D-amino acid oxidase-like deaminating enzyme
MTQVAVIGAGVVGLSTAMLLAQAGQDVTVWDAGTAGNGASSSAHGEIVPPHDEKLRPLWLESLRIYDQVAQATGSDLGMDQKPIGTLVVACDEASAQLLAARNSAGDGKTCLRADLESIEPLLGEAAIAGLLFEEGRRCDPRSVVGSIALAARMAGACLRCGESIVSVVQKPNGRWQLYTSQGTTFEYKTVVIAAGLATKQLCTNVAFLPLIGLHGRILKTEPRPPMLNHVIAEVGIGRADATHAMPFLREVADPNRSFAPVISLGLHQNPDGSLLIGTSWQPDHEHTPANLNQMLAERALELIPRSADIRVVGAWSGVRPGSIDGLPIIDQIETSLYICCGHGGSGFITGPGSASLLAQIILGQDTCTRAAAFRLNRPTASIFWRRAS